MERIRSSILQKSNACVYLWAWLGVLVLWLGACADAAPGAGPAAGECRQDRDCLAEEVCREGQCGAPLCQSSQECPFAFDCIQGVCLEIEDYCNRNSDCRNGFLCDRALRRCIPLDQVDRSCTRDSDCFSDEMCLDGFCDTPEPDPCALCSPDQTCINEVCADPEPEPEPDLPEEDLVEPPEDLPVEPDVPEPDMDPPVDMVDEPDMGAPDMDPPDMDPPDMDPPDMDPPDLPVDMPPEDMDPPDVPEPDMDSPDAEVDMEDMEDMVDEPDMEDSDVFVPPPTPAPGFYDYRLLEIGGLGGLQTIRFAPSGEVAVAIEIRDKVHLINHATEEVTTFEPDASPGYDYSFQDIAFDPSGDFALIVGLEFNRDGVTQGVILRLDLDNEETGLPTLTRYDITLERAIYDILYPWDGGFPILLADREVSNNFHNAVLRDFDPEAGSFGSFFTAAISQDSCRHMAYAVNGFGRRGLFLSCNFNLLYYTEVGGVGEWRMDREIDASNLGNTLGTTEHRPGDYALLFTGFGTRRVRMFRDGLLRDQNMSLSNHSPSYAAFQQEGQRALFIGDRSGRLLEFRHGTFEGCTSSPYAVGCLTDASINIGAPPYSAPDGGRSVSFTGAAWKPGCDGGYLVTNDNNSRGMVIAFQLVGGRPCAP